MHTSTIASSLASLRLLLPLTGLAIALPACVFPTTPGEDDDAASEASSDATGGSADTDPTEDGGSSSSADETGLDEESGAVETVCDDAEVAAHVYEHSGITEGEHWPLGIHRVSGSFAVHGPLSVEPCSIIQMGDDARFQVGSGGSLQWHGEVGQPITVTSDKDTPAPGDWEAIHVEADSVGPDNELRHVVIEHGGDGSYGALHLYDGASLSMQDSVVRHSAGLGMLVVGEGELRDFTGNVLTDNADGPISIAPNHVGELGPGTYAPNGVDGIQLAASPGVSHDQTWLAHDAPYVASHGFTVETSAGSAHLTVAAGVELRMGDGADIVVTTLGGLTLAGTEDDPILIRSAKSSGAPGDWNELELHGASVDAYNDFSHVIIEHGGGGSYGSVYVRDEASLAMRDCTVRMSGNEGLWVADGGELRELVRSTLIDNVGAPISIRAPGVDSLGVGTYGPNGVDGILVRHGTVDHDARWLDHGVPYVADTGFYVATEAGSAVLVLDPGTRLHLGDGADVRVQDNGALAAEGTAEQRVVITSSKPIPAPGDWHELRFENGSIDASNVLRYTDVTHGGGGVYGMIYTQDDASVMLEHVTLEAAGGGCDLAGTGTFDTVATPFVECP